MAYRQVSIAVTAFLLMAAAPVGKIAQAATAEQFQVRTTADYVAVCTTSPNDDTYQAAIAFCHGFAVGAYQYYAAVAEVSSQDRYVCLPDPPPSRVTALTEFVTWVKGNPQYMQDRPVDSIFHFLKTRYPCS
ncbi:Rap1a/Tai family immunity protein [Dongia soli]|uniref:Rap1a/Tai family immunity protein n=1 Tax=Dongia soli TaxID=600628 RepID=A0ABU5EG50_9PROT|nr:Rap1a/Tai family immunity protein [Dongia soli]MDY0884571.1 Rap1a/Tai family immunity protein [Dongia soli]